jgi:hypothetical protein
MLLAELVELDREAWRISEQERVSGPSWVSALVAVANRSSEPGEGRPY